MDRNEKIRRIADQSRVARISDIAVTDESLHPDYERVICDGIRGETGSLELLRIIPKSANRAYFVARWDQRPEELDIDIRDASPDVVRKFEGKKGGYSGHRTNRSTDPGKRVFDVKITIPNEVVFQGRVSFTNHYEMKAQTGIYVNDVPDAELIRAQKSEE
jgi:hypothetical protein